MSNSRVTQTATAKTEDSLSPLKLSKYLAAIIIFFSATQLGLHFWPSSTLVYGIRIDYLSPTLYFLDLLIIVYLVLSRQFRPFSGLQSSERQVGTFVIPFLLTNLLYSQNPLATLSWSFHLVLYFVFITVLLPQFRPFSGLQRSKRRVGTSVIIAPLTFSLLFQTILAAAQVYLGHSVGGIMYYLGERMVSVGSPNIALGTFMDQITLRAYGTFSHPNILAGYAVISYLILLQASQTATPKASKQWAFLIPVLLILFLTQSRSAAISLFGIIVPFYLIQKTKYRATYFAIAFCLVIFNSPLLLPARSDLSFSQRHTLQGASLSVIRSFPVFGTGAQSSISTYPLVDSSVRLLQPDHNSFTLFLSWFGIFGLFALFPEFRSLRDFFPLIPLLLFDHYLLTSPQGLFILLLYLRVTMSYGQKTINNIF